MRVYAFLLTLTLSAFANGQTGCWTDGIVPNFPVTTIDVYVNSSFYSEPIGTLNDPQRRTAVRQILAKFKAESGSSLHLRWRGVDDTKTCPHDAQDQANPFIAIRISDEGGSFWGTGLRRFKSNGIDYNCGLITLNEPQMVNRTRDQLQTLMLHELGHALGTRHAEECTHTVTHQWGCWYNSYGCCYTANGRCNGNTPFASRLRSPYLQKPDKVYLRSDVGRADAMARSRYGYGLPPSTWRNGSGWAVGTVVSAVASAGGVGAIGHMYNVQTSGLGPQAWVHATDVTRPSAWASYYRPDLARSSGQPTNRWLGVFLYKDTLTDWVKDVRVVERSATGSPWTLSAIDVDVTLPHVAVAYDPQTDRFVVAVETSDGIRFLTRPVGGGAWTFSQTALSTFGGVDFDCNVNNTVGSDNCVMAYIERGDNGLIRSRHFRVNVNGTVTVSSTSTAVGAGGFNIRGLSRPTIAANPEPGNPQFILSYSQHSDTIETLKLNQGALLWSAGTSTQAQAEDWMPPAGLSIWTFFNLDVTNLSIGY